MGLGGVWVGGGVGLLGGRVDREPPAVAPEVTRPRPPERRPKASGEPMVRPTTVMLLEVAVVALVQSVLAGSILLMDMDGLPPRHPVAMEAPA